MLARGINLKVATHVNLLPLFVEKGKRIRKQETGFLFAMDLILAQVPGFGCPFPSSFHHGPCTHVHTLGAKSSLTEIRIAV